VPEAHDLISQVIFVKENLTQN